MKPGIDVFKVASNYLPNPDLFKRDDRASVIMNRDQFDFTLSVRRGIRKWRSIFYTQLNVIPFTFIAVRIFLRNPKVAK